MATLIQATNESNVIGAGIAVKFLAAPQAGNLILVYAIRRNETSTPPEDLQGGWTEITTMYPHIGVASPGRLFSRISTGAEYSVGPGPVYNIGIFGPAEKLLAVEFEVPGIGSATPSAITGPSTWANLGGAGSVEAKQSVTTDDLAVMVFHGKTFGFNLLGNGGSSIEAILWGDADWPAVIVYRTGTGSLENEVDWSASQDGGYEYVSVAFGVAEGDEPLVCGFSAAPTSGIAPLEVAFTDETEGEPDGWLWDFGDGDTSTDQNPTHEYTEPGTYTVTLTVTRSSDDAECELEIEAFITISSAGVLIDWANDGFEPGTTDEVSGTPQNVVSWVIQRGAAAEITGGAQPGSATIVLKNPDDIYNPRNESSPLFGKLRDGSPIWIGPNSDGRLSGDDPRGLFGGRITDITLLPAGGAAVSPFVEITCEDMLGWARYRPIVIGYAEGRSHKELREQALIAAGETRYDLADEIHTMPLSHADTDLLSVLDDINAANGTRHFVKPANSHSLWFAYTTRNRRYGLRGVGSESLNAFDDHVTGTSGWRLSADTVINQQRATVTPVKFTPATFTVWEAEKLPFNITHRRPFKRKVEFDDVVWDPVLDYAKNGDPVSASFTPSGTGGTVELTVGPGDEATIIALSIEGRLARRKPQETYEANDVDSQAEPRGIRAGGEIGNEYLGVMASAVGIAEHVVWRYGNPQLRPTLTVENWLPEQFELDLYDVIEFTSTQLGMTGRLFEIVGLTHEGRMASPGPVHHITTYVLQESRVQGPTTWFTLDGPSHLAPGDPADHLAY